MASCRWDLAGFCEMEPTGSTFVTRDGVEYELWECVNCHRGEDRRVEAEDDWDPEEFR